MPHIDYYLSVMSPFAYLANDGLERIAEKHGATISYKPIDLLGLFAQTGGKPPGQRHESRQAYRLQELQRLAAHSGMKLNLHPAHWPTDPKPASALVTAAQMAGHDAGELARAVLRSVWADEKDISDPQTLDALLIETEIDPASLGPHMHAAKAAFETLTAEALEAGVFGAPFYIVEGERFWGQDRLPLLDWHLGRIG